MSLREYSPHGKLFARACIEGWNCGLSSTSMCGWSCISCAGEIQLPRGKKANDCLLLLSAATVFMWNFARAVSSTEALV